MPVRVATSREYKWPVAWESGDDAGEMEAVFYLPTEAEFNEIPQNDKKALLGLVLKDVIGLEIEHNGKVVKQLKRIKSFILADGELSRAFYDAFMELWAKKTLPATWQMQASTIMELLSQSRLNEAD